MTSTRPELESVSFLSELDMDPVTTQLTATTSAVLSRTSIPNIFASGTGSPAGDGSSPSFLGGFTPPQISRAGTPNSSKGDEPGATNQKKTGFVDFRRFVTFGTKRDSTVG